MALVNPVGDSLIRRVHAHGANAHLLRRSRDASSNLATIGDDQGPDRA